MAQVLGAKISSETPELCAVVCNALITLINQNKIDAGTANGATAGKNLQALANYARNFMPLFFNAYTGMLRSAITSTLTLMILMPIYLHLVLTLTLAVTLTLKSDTGSTENQALLAVLTRVIEAYASIAPKQVLDDFLP